MIYDRADIEKDRLAWLRQNLLVRVERSAAEGSRLSTWLITGSAAVFILALKAEMDSVGSTVGPCVLTLLWVSLVAAGAGAACGYFVGYQAVRDFDAGVNATDRLVRVLAEGDPVKVADAEAAVSKSGHAERLGRLLFAALILHILSAAFLAVAGLIALITVV